MSDRHDRKTTVAEIEHGLPSVLARLLGDRGRWILILDEIPVARFLQFLALEDGTTLVAEVSSNEFLSGDDVWGPEEQDQLFALGWQAPESPSKPNYYVVGEGPGAVEQVLQITATTLRNVFRLRADDTLLVTMMESDHTRPTHAAENVSTLDPYAAPEEIEDGFG